MNEEKIKTVIVVRKDLNMRKGKLAAQVAHSQTLYYEFLYDCKCRASQPNDYGEYGEDYFYPLFEYHKKWIETGYTKIVVSVDSEEELKNLISYADRQFINNFPVYDFGLTEFHGNKTLTCCAFGPDTEEHLEFTKDLKLL